MRNALGAVPEQRRHGYRSRPGCFELRCHFLITGLLDMATWTCLSRFIFASIGIGDHIALLTFDTADIIHALLSYRSKK